MTFALRAVARLLKMRKQSEKTTRTVNKEENSTSDFTAAIFSALQLAVCLKSLFNSFIGLDHHSMTIIKLFFRNKELHYNGSAQCCVVGINVLMDSMISFVENKP